MQETSGHHQDTVVIHGDRDQSSSGALSPPIFQTSAFRAASAEEFANGASDPRHDRFYTRYGNPNHTQAAAVIARLERAEAALIFPSGMGAMAAALLSLCKPEDHVVAQRSMYAGTHNLLHDILEPLGVTCTLVDQTSDRDFTAAIRDNTRVIVVETPSNPLLTITDLRAIAQLGKGRGIITIADNTFATPINQLPIELGIDIAMHSATKYLGGHSDLSAGALASSEGLIERIRPVSVKLGLTVNGFDSWLLLRGMRTLALRVERQNQNARAIAEFLQGRNEIATVSYPGLHTHAQHKLASAQMRGFGGMLSFELRGGAAAVEPFIRSLRLITRASSLGGVETTLVHQSAMWASIMSGEQMRQAGIAPALLRLSVGIEHQDDLIADLEGALNLLP
ncbi:MAG: aminotransferase class I/II-fold pyridoxal phosphate-dependent enzyme [Vulcanimicrobiaceae bacterium]